MLLFVLFFLIIDLYYLIAVVVVQIFNPIAELAISIGISTKEAKAEMKTQPVIVELKIRKCSIQFTVFKVFLCHIFKVILYFQLNQEFLISQLNLLL